MGRLTFFELRKVWFKRSFLICVCALFISNLFFLWYVNTGNNKNPELSAYKLFSADISGMTEAGKGAFLEDLKQTIDGVSFVGRILTMQNSEIGANFARQEMEENPGVYETYLELFLSGDYLRYTDSLELESVFINELYSEERKVADYGAYLASIRERKDYLNGISVFASQNADGFAYKNIQKSADDFKELSSSGIRWEPSKSVASAMESVWTDILLILLSFLFTGVLITEEKQKGLFYVTRSTKYGMGPDIVSRLSALFIHCLVSTALLYVSNILYFGFTAGWCDMSARIQSLAPYMESSLPVSILGFIVLSVITKALALFAAGALLTAFCILSENAVLPYFCGMILWSVSWALYRFVPAASKASALKYGNLFGVLRTETLYGTYLNLDMWGHPVSRLWLSMIVVGFVILTGVVTGFFSFVKGERMSLKRAARPVIFPFRPHVSLFKHEGYKLLIANHGLIILFVFCCLISHNIFRRDFALTAQEQYYRNIMLNLEGDLTVEKTALIMSESSRYREAFEEIENIDRMTASGEIDDRTGDEMKRKWYEVTAFYREFQRVERQFEQISLRGGKFIYDTGYLYLFGVQGDSGLIDFIFMTMGIVLVFSHVFSVEYQSGAWPLLCATARGGRGVTAAKTAVCCLGAAVFSVMPFVFRCISVARVFPLHGIFFPAQSIPLYEGVPSFVPVAALVCMKAFVQTVVGLILALIVTGLSRWRKSYVQTVFFGILFLCAPAFLAALGFEFAGKFSFYPLYAGTFT